MSNKRSILNLRRSSRWANGYLKPIGRWAKRMHNKKVRKYSGAVSSQRGIFKHISPLVWEWC